MRTLPWVRSALIAELREDLWRHLTPAASVERDLLEAAALLQLSAYDLRTLGRVQFLISEELGALLDVLPRLARRLATTTASEEEWSADRVRGAIQWGRTLGVRQATGIPNLYVTTPSRRAFQTPENELLVYVLDAVVTISRQLGWHQSTSVDVGRLVSGRVAVVERWLQMRALAQVERRPLGPSKLARIRSGRHMRRYREVLCAFERHHELVKRLDRESIRKAVETFGLVSRDDPTLFELLCTFKTLDALKANGWTIAPLGLFGGTLQSVGSKGADRIEVGYQATPRALSAASPYAKVQHVHGIRAGRLRPDLVIHRTGESGDRWLVVEVKGGERSVGESARAAAYDLMAYRTAFGPVLDRQDGWYGLGIAWGAELAPNYSEPVCLCTPDTLPDALGELVG
ncbi:MAG TPA: hypothetical protein VM690_04705 [Gaiellaceae bacterium]|nr:hypothetical protein [Gaiellaceae bacterium]